MQIHKGILIIIIIIACLLSYFNTLFADFVWDDNIFITPNPYMKSFKFLPKFFVQDFWKIGIKTVISEFYRPLLAATFMLDFTIWGNNPLGFHLTNILYHIFASILVFLFVELLLKDRLVSFFSALLFSVHPIHTEAVSFISGRVDSIPLVFYLFSLILFLKYAFKKRLIFYLFSLFSFLISLLTKEMAVTLPLVVILIDYFFFSKTKVKEVIRNFPRFHCGFFVILGLYLFIRFQLLGLSFLSEKNIIYVSNFYAGTGILWRLFTVIKIITFYIRLLFFPYGLNADYFFPPANSLFEPVVLIGLVLLLILIFIAIKNVKRQPILSFSIVWFFITLLPVSNIFPEGNIFAERYIYTPSVGFCIGIGFLFSGLLKKNIKTNFLDYKKSVYIVFFLLITALIRVTYERNKVWYNDLALWSDTVKATPDSARAHINLANVYYSKNLLDEALDVVDKATQLFSNASAYSFVVFEHLRGHIYLKKGLIDQALSVFKKVVELIPNNAEFHYSLALAYGMKSQYKEAIEEGLKSLKENPYLESARYNLALHYLNAGFIDKAIDIYEEYLKVNPQYVGVYVDVGNLYYKKGNYQKAREHWLAALKINKDYQPAKDALRLLEDIKK